MAKRRSRTTTRPVERDLPTFTRSLPRARPSTYLDDFAVERHLANEERARQRAESFAAWEDDEFERATALAQHMAETDQRRWSPHPPRLGSRVVIGKTPKTPAKASKRAVAAFWTPPVLTPQVRFAEPLRVALCHRRSIRKQVLHALGLTGRGSGGRGRRTFWSQVVC